MARASLLLAPIPDVTPNMKALNNGVAPVQVSPRNESSADVYRERRRTTMVRSRTVERRRLFSFQNLQSRDMLFNRLSARGLSGSGDGKSEVQIVGREEETQGEEGENGRESDGVAKAAEEDVSGLSLIERNLRRRAERKKDHSLNQSVSQEEGLSRKKGGGDGSREAASVPLSFGSGSGPLSVDSPNVPSSFESEGLNISTKAVGQGGEVSQLDQELRKKESGGTDEAEEKESSNQRDPLDTKESSNTENIKESSLQPEASASESGTEGKVLMQLPDGLDPKGTSGFEGEVVLPDGQAVGASQSEKREKESKVKAARWRDIVGVPICAFFFGPDGNLVPQTKEMETAIFNTLDQTGMDALEFWSKEKVQLILTQVLKDSGFGPTGKGSLIVSKRTASLLVQGKLTTAAPDALKLIQRNVEKRSGDLIPILVQGDEGPAPNAAVSFLPKDTLLTFTTPGPIPLLVSLLSFSLSLYVASTASTLAIDLPQFSITSIWQSSISPLSLFVTFSAGAAARVSVAAVHKALPSLAAPLFLPSPSLASFGLVSGFKGLLPNRTSALDIPLASSLASIGTSSLLVLVGSLASRATQVGEIPADYIFVPSTIFGSSGFFADLAASLASAVVLPDKAVEDSLGAFIPSLLASPDTPQLVMDPLIFGGLLALHASLMCLIPCGKLDGGTMMTAILNPKAAELISRAAVLLFGLKFISQDLQSGVLWVLAMVIFVLPPGGGWPVREDLTDPGLIRKTVSLLTLLAASYVLLA